MPPPPSLLWRPVCSAPEGQPLHSGSPGRLSWELSPSLLMGSGLAYILSGIPGKWG